MDSVELALRLATPADEPAISSLMKTSAAGIFPAYYDERQVASAITYVADVDRTLLTDGTYFVFETAAEIVACGGWSRRKRPYAGSEASPDDDVILDPKTDAAHVRAMFVRPDWTRRGLGRRIIEACEEAALGEGYRNMHLVVTLPGVPLYLSCGFVPTGPEQDIVLADGVLLPCLEMSKPLRPQAASGDTAPN